MTKLEDSRIEQIVPGYLAQKQEVKALSYAINRALRRAMEYSDKTGVFASIDTASDEVLDLLAIELGTQYYDTSLAIDRKRELISNTMLWYMSAGTKSAVEELADSIFGGLSEIEEWFEYNGSPGTFRMYVDISDSVLHPVSDVDVNDMINKMAKSKRLSAHLDSLSYMVRHVLTISKKIESWAYGVPQCGTVYCGTYWMPSTLGYTEDPEIHIQNATQFYLYTPDFAGTKPDISTLGYSAGTTEEVSGRADAFNAFPPESGTENAGTQPDIATLGHSLGSTEEVSAAADAYTAEPGESGLIDSGTYPQEATLGNSIESTEMIGEQADIYRTEHTQSGTYPEISTQGYNGSADQVAVSEDTGVYIVTLSQSGTKFCGVS